MKTLLRRAILSIALAGAVPALAAEPSQDYAALRAGLYLPQAQPSAQGSSYRTNVAVELAAGRAFLPFLLGELGVGFARAESGEFSEFYPGTINFVPMTARFSLVPITATVKFVLPGGSIEPYALGGVGLYLISFEQDPTNGLPAVSDSGNAVGFSYGLGANWHAAERILVGLDARYTRVGRSFSGNWYRFDGLGLTASLGYRF